MKLTQEFLAEQLSRLSDRDLVVLDWKIRWKNTARPKQLAPEGPWNNWGILSGRGFGKTRLAANWLGLEASQHPKSYNFVIAPTHDDVRNTCFEGPTGLLTEMPQKLIADYNKSLQIITVDNGASIRGFSATEPERLRGPQHHRGWGDEVASWLYPEETYKMMKLGNRLGDNPKFCWTGTPKPLPIIRQLLKAPNSVIVRGSTYENRANLAKSFFDELKEYEGTKLERQELFGELLEAEEDGIVQRSHWKMWPANKPLPKFTFIIMSLDTAYTEKTFDRKTKEPDPSACSVWGVFTHNNKVNAMLLDRWSEHLGLPELIKRVKVERKNTYGDMDEPLIKSAYGRPLIFAREPQASHQGRPIDLILIEEKGSGISLRQMLGEEDILTWPYNPKRDSKLTRLHMVSNMFVSGRVWAVESDKIPNQFKSYMEPLISNVCSYHGEGTVAHDDDVDTTTQALIYIKQNFMGPMSDIINVPTPDEVALALMPIENPYAQ